MIPVSFISLVAMLVILCLALPSPAESAAPTVGKRPFAGVRPDSIVSLVVAHRQDTARLVKVEGRWITSRLKYPVDPAKIAEALKSMLLLEALPIEQPKNQSGPAIDYELGPGMVKKVTWKDTRGKTNQVLIGRLLDRPQVELDEDPAHTHDPAHQEHWSVVPLPKDSTYWSRPGKRQVFRTPGNPGGISAQESWWEDRNVFPFFIYEDVVSVSATWRDSAGKSHHYRLDRTSDTSAVLVEPHRAPVPRKNAARIFVQTPQLAVDEVIAPDNQVFAQVKFDQPELVLHIRMKDGKQHSLLVGEVAGEFHYAKHPAYGIPVKIARWRLHFFKATVKELLRPPLKED